MKLLPNPGMTELYASVINDAYKKKFATNGAEAKELTARLKALNDDINKARKKFMTNKISEKDYRKLKQECELEMQRTETLLLGK